MKYNRIENQQFGKLFPNESLVAMSFLWAFEEDS